MPMTESDLCALIDKESRQAIGADDLTADQRVKAMEYYLGEAKGELAPPETPGRSQVVSKDLMDTVEWAMPSLMDIFASSDDIISFEPDGPEDEQACKDATNYIGWLIHRKNEDGFVTIHDAIKAALLMRAGWGKTCVETSQEVREEVYRNQTYLQVKVLREDQDVDVISEVADGEINPELAPPGLPPEALVTYTVRARLKQEEVTIFRNEGVPGNEMRIAKDTRVLSECRFIEHRRPVTLSYLLERGYPKDKVLALATDDGGAETDEESSRHTYDGTYPEIDGSPDPAQKEVELSDSYLRVDFDGDGKVEYRRVVKAHGVVFENEVTDDHPFWLMTPILMPYKVMGLGFWDLVEDLQRIKTALSRQVLDNVYLSNNPRTVYAKNKVNLDDLLSPRPGGLIEAETVDAVREYATPFVAGAGLQIIESIDQIRDTRTGVTEMNSAVNAESLAKGSVGSEGVQALMNAGAQRLRLIARVLAETGFKRMYYLMLKNVTQHQDQAQQVKINGRWLNVDPREWKNRYNMTVSVGVGTFGRQQQIANLTLIGTTQEKVLPLGLATKANIYQTATRMVEAMGYRDADQFFTAPPPPKPGQPEETGGQQEGSAEAQAIIAAEQIKAQASLQNAQQDAQVTLRKAEMDNQTRLQIAREEIASKEKVAMFEAQQRIAIEREKALRDVMRPSNPPPSEVAA